jgi:hypothetical protein
MSLYKYYSYAGGLAAIDSQQYGFREPRHFNDPFEFTYLFGASSESKAGYANKIIEDLRKRVCVLCFTRSNVNPLMWAHYGDSHKGFVVEYDVDDKFLTSSEYNLVPVQAGDVAYPSKNADGFLKSEDVESIRQVFSQGCGESVNLLKSHLSIVQALYLKKHEVWSYEEEVRVVKLVDSLFEETHVFLSDPLRSYTILIKDIEGKPGCAMETQPGLKLFDKHVAKIKSVYFGARNPLLRDKSRLDEKIAKWRTQGVQNFFRMDVAPSSWLLNPRDVVNLI